jgi:hypothetical protein
VLSSTPGHRRRKYLAIQRVPEGEAPGDRAVGPCGDSRAAQKRTDAGEAVAPLLCFPRAAIRPDGGDGGRELDPTEARRLEQLAVLRVQAVELLFDHRPQTLRDGGQLGAKPLAHHPTLVSLDDRSACEQVIDEGHQEERVAAGPLAEEPCHLVREAAPCEAALQVLRHGVDPEIVERDLATTAARQQSLRDCPQRMVRENQLDGAIGREHKEPSRLRPHGDERQQIHRRRIAPVEIFEHEDERDLGAERLDELRHLAQHALAGGAEQVTSEPVTVLLFDEPGELREPGRGVAAQRDRVAPFRTSRPTASSTGM